MHNAPPEVQALFGKLFADMNRTNLELEEKSAQIDPRSHRLSRTFSGPGGTNYHYFTGGRNGKGQSILFCWSIHRNVAGYFLTWRQVRQQNGITKRDQWAARKSRRACIAIAQRRREAFNLKMAPTGDAEATA